MTQKSLFSLLSLLPAYFISCTLAKQYPLTGTHAHQTSLYDQVNFTTLFAPSSFDHKSGPVTAWAPNTKVWNGLTTFASAKPLQCFGGSDETYDVAVLGMSDEVTFGDSLCSLNTRCAF